MRPCTPDHSLVKRGKASFEAGHSSFCVAFPQVWDSDEEGRKPQSPHMAQWRCEKAQRILDPRCGD